MKIRGVLALAVILVSGCYHVTVDTGRTPSGQVIEREWAHSFLYGLVPPSTVETAQRCPDGVAKVETELSFLNQVANFLTFGIYTPMSISVQCAAASSALNGSEVRVQPNATTEEARAAVGRAAAVSADAQQPVFVRFMAE